MNAVQVARYMFHNDGMRRVTGNSTDRRPSRLASVQRVLFPEAVDHEETREFHRREMQRITREFRERWNFDFETQTPLVGRYEWERLTVGTEAIHPSYEQRQLTRSLESRLAPKESNPEASISSSNTAAASSARTESSSATVSCSSDDKGPSKPQERDPVPPTLVSPQIKPDSGSSTSKPVQRKLTEFMTKRKRSDPVKSTDASSRPKNKIRKTTTT